MPRGVAFKTLGRIGMVYDVVSKHGCTTISVLSHELGTTRAQTWSALRYLEKVGLIRRQKFSRIMFYCRSDTVLTMDHIIKALNFNGRRHIRISDILQAVCAYISSSRGRTAVIRVSYILRHLFLDNSPIMNAVLTDILTHIMHDAVIRVEREETKTRIYVDIKKAQRQLQSICSG